MKFKNYNTMYSVFVWILMFFSVTTLSGFAQENAAFSGKVVDERGDPVVGITLEIRPFLIKAGGNREEGFVQQLVRQTDIDGSFSITRIPPVSVKLDIGGYYAKTKIISIDMGDLTLYPEGYSPFPKMRFSLAPGANIEDVIIKVNTEIIPQISARVVSADGTPIVDSQIRVNMISRDLDGTGSDSRSRSNKTNSEGYFTEKLRVDKDPQFYVIAIEYQGYFAKADPFLLQDGQPEVYLLLKLNETQIPVDERTPDRVSTEFRKLLNPPSVWVLNSENGHYYKKIYCHSIDNAIVQADAEKAYLVSINDKAEDQWIKNITGRSRFLIGLSDMEEEGKWIWHSGEAVTYTNWVNDKQLPGNTEIKDYVIVGPMVAWQLFAFDNDFRNFPLMTILERANLTDEIKPESK